MRKTGMLALALLLTVALWGYSSTGGGWRKNQNYYDMRELLGMPDES